MGMACSGLATDQANQAETSNAHKHGLALPHQRPISETLA
jgi:hypothetical protein